MGLDETTIVHGGYVLCADDDPLVRGLIEKYLSDKGYTVTTCENGQELLETFATRPADIVILDLSMPVLSGLETLKYLRADPAGASIPILIVSVADTEDELTQGLAAGADDYLIKPVNRSELVVKVANAAKRKRLANLASRGVGVGTRFNDRYEIIDRIGSGGFSTVYRARDTEAKDERIVALKIFDFGDSTARDTRFLQLFLREAYEHSRLDHPNIVKLHDFGRSGNLSFMVMELIEGQTVSHLLEEAGHLSEADSVWIAYEVSKALKYLGEHGLIHRDVKPLNIMVTTSGQVKLLDFGLARRRTDDTLSINAELRGTPQYMSPEYVRGDEDLDISTDVYSLGVTLYCMVSGELPITGKTSLEVVQRQLSLMPTPLDQEVPGVDPRLVKLVAGMLHKNRFYRTNIDEVVATLKELQPEHEQ